MTQPTPDSPRPPTTQVPAPLARARAIAWVMDDLVPIPGTRWRIGVDPLLGLFPAVGDWVSWSIGFYLLVAAAQLRAGAPLLLRMLGNILGDAVAGVVPLLGDLFDATWKANNRNLELLEAHVAAPERTARRSRFLVGAVLVSGLGVLAAGAWAAGWLVVKAVGLVF
ncbi:MAG: DUF4112 domain-containing protein [Gemmatimonadales bacterium]|nr:MAG: DUF4112 domain-containing protein [Gemmatimonadales bacterium]